MADDKPTLGQAIDKVIAALSPFNDSDRKSILGLVELHLGMSSTDRKNVEATSETVGEAPAIPRSSACEPREGRRDIDIRALKEEKKPHSARQMACLVAYYLQEYAPANERKNVIPFSTSAATTSAGKYAVGKFMKLRSDMLFLTLVEGTPQKFIVLTEKIMYDACLKERGGGRVPKDIDFLWAEIPPSLEQRLIHARHLASKEVTPPKLGDLPVSVLLEFDLSEDEKN